MPASSTEAQTCSDRGCNGQHLVAERVAMAEVLCGERGAQLTATRREVLELLWSYERPAGAYDLIEKMCESGNRRVAPPTVYRALEFLTAQGLASKIESRNAYVPCAHPERGHDCQFVICTDCGASTELEDPRVERLLAENATRLGYHVVRRIVEIEGLCAACAQTDEAERSAEAES